ncbi:MAG: PQQ-dependent sugar dehydrogenase [Labilithrix sp.]|nr:PQQ-dependent sugar dehydrogenase [Labilithrix sp.]MCW5813272.1 PQQ-dependent sugar dehydrogenase [Labilithrix sp.]
MAGAACAPSDATEESASELNATANDDPWGPRSVLPSGTPVENRPPNASSQRPAFRGQTRSPGDRTNVAFDVRVTASGLSRPWAIAFLPDGAKLVTERPGRMRIIAENGALSEPLAGLPAIAARGQGGLLDVVLAPSFAETSQIYFTYSEPRTGGNGLVLARAKLVRGATPSLTNVESIWRMTQTSSSSVHFGSRIVFDRDGHVFVTVGERGVSNGAGNARDLGSSYGKVIRLNLDGSIPLDNPYVNRPGALPEVFSSGHRNPQSAALHPKTGQLWTVEHGARGGDEVNIIRPGKDYGWPTVTYGIDYSGATIGSGVTAAAGIEQPVYYWDPVIAPAGAAFYDAAAFPAWRGSLFVGGLAGEHLVRLTISEDRVVGEERLLTARRARIRDVRVGPAGTIFVSDETNGQILELVPRGS